MKKLFFYTTFSIIMSSIIYGQMLKDTVVDRDGNVYHTVKIGTQIWMIENLKVTHYRNGNIIPNIADNTNWKNLTTGAYCNYNNDTNKAMIYGRLYNWYAVTDSRNICPRGWHVPNDTEWTTLTTYVGENVAGTKLKAKGTTHCENSPDTWATNESGFTALPGGHRTEYEFSNIGYGGNWWSSTECILIDNKSGYDNKAIYCCAFSRYMLCHYSDVTKGCNKKTLGFSVRCVKDN
jgi:uncharacterized protein (TIGR02145 family)